MGGNGSPMQAYLGAPFAVPRVPSTSQTGPFRLPATHEKYFAYLHRFQTGAPSGPLVPGDIGRRDSLTIDGDADFKLKRVALWEEALNAQGANVGPAMDDTITFELTPLSEAVTFPKVFLSGLGNGQLPTPIRPPYLLKRNAVWTAVADARSPIVYATQTILVAHHGAKCYPQVIRPEKLYARARMFCYTMSFTAFDAFQNGGVIGAGATVIGSVRSDGDSDFVVQRLVVLSDTPVQFQIQTDNDQWSHVPMRFDLVGGTAIQAPGVGTNLSGWYPFELPAERFIGPAQTITAVVSNLDPNVATRCQLQFWGTRFYAS
jgi:hypothetical protein